MKVTITDIAKEAGVSKSAVSKVLNNHTSLVGAATREKILEVTKRLNYRPNPFAQSLKTGKTNIIGIVMGANTSTSVFKSTYLSGVCAGIGETLEQHSDYKMLFHNFSQLTDQDNDVQLASSKVVDGIISIVYSHAAIQYAGGKRLEIMQAQQIPFVMAHSLAREFPFHSVGVDMKAGSYAATEHLIEHGYTSIGFVNLSVVTPIIEDMLTGFKQALQKHGLTARPDHIYTLPETEPGTQGYNLAKQLVAAKQKLPRALLVTDEIAARGIITCFREAGLAIPEDLAIISAGNSSQRAFDPDGLSRIEQPVREKGMKAAEKMIHLIYNPQDLDKPESIILKPTLELGISCGCE